MYADARVVAEMLAITPLALRLTQDCLNRNLDAGGLRAAIAMEGRNQILCTLGVISTKASAPFLKSARRCTARRRSDVHCWLSLR